MKIQGFVYAVLFIAAGIIFAGCEEDPTDVGIGVQPGDEELGVFTSDTITIKAHSMLADSIRTDETEFSLIGSHYDPVFGVTTASVFTSFALSAAEHDFGENATPDSLVLMLQYDTYTGDTTTPQLFHAYPLTENLSADSSYYSNQLIGYDETNDYATENMFYPRPTDSIRFDTTVMRPHARMPMADELGEYLMDAGESDMESTENFKDYFKGLALITEKETQPGAGSIISYNLTKDFSRLRLYYHNDEDTTYFDYIVGTATPRTNHFNHYGYAEASNAFKQQMLEGDTTEGAQQVYLQTMAGVRVKVSIPELENTDKTIIINDAQLITSPRDNGPYKTPERLYLIGLEEDGALYDLPDFIEGTSYFRGALDDNNKYNFRLSMYIQNLISGNALNNEMLMGIPEESSQYKRLILDGYGSDQNRIKVKMTYTVPD